MADESKSKPKPVKAKTGQTGLESYSAWLESIEEEPYSEEPYSELDESDESDESDKGGFFPGHKKTCDCGKCKAEREKDYTPSFDFSEKVVTDDGKERKIDLAPSGLYLFDKKEKFPSPPPKKEPQTGMWVGIEKPHANGQLVVPWKPSAKIVKAHPMTAAIITTNAAKQK
jgi:hypothetical protein